MRGMGGMPSDCDAIQQGRPTTGCRSPPGPGWYSAGMKAGARVWIKEIDDRSPQLGPPGDDVFDIDPGWGRI